MKGIVLNGIFILLSFSIFGQVLNLSIDKDEIKIGEPFLLNLKIYATEKPDTILYTPYSTNFPAKSAQMSAQGIDSPAELELLDHFTDTLYEKDNQYVWEGTYRLTGWDSAYVVIPPEKIYINDSLYYFPAGLIRITSPVADASKPIFDINESFTEIKEDKSFLGFLKKHGWWMGVLLGGIIVFFIINKRKKSKPVTPLSLRQLTLGKIDKLERSKGYEDNLKEYYYELSIILRRFFDAYYQVPIMDKTTLEIEKVLSEHGLDKDVVAMTRKLLTHSDMVKFAKSKPALTEILSVTDEARRVVNEVADLDLENEK